MSYNEIIILGVSSIAMVSYCLKLAVARNASIKVIETIHKASKYIILAYIPFSIQLYYNFPLPIVPSILISGLIGCAGLVSSSIYLNRCKRVTVTLKLNSELLKFKDYLQSNYAKQRLKHIPHFDSDTYILEDPFSNKTLVFNVCCDRLEIHGAQGFVNSFANYFSSNKVNSIPIL
jgi:hypothetical protein